MGDRDVPDLGEVLHDEMRRLGTGVGQYVFDSLERSFSVPDDGDYAHIALQRRNQALALECVLSGVIDFLASKREEVRATASEMESVLARKGLDL